VRFELLTAVNMEISVLVDATSYSLVLWELCCDGGILFVLHKKSCLEYEDQSASCGHENDTSLFWKSYGTRKCCVDNTELYTLHKGRCFEELTFWHRSFTFNSNKSPTWCNNFSVYYRDVCLQLNMFRAFSPLHQELNDCSDSLWFYLRIVVTVVLCSWSGRPARPQFN
jgi:hypothetical protein